VTIGLPPTSVLGEPARIPFPAAGASIAAVEGLGTLGSGGAPTPRPIASVTKMMTAHLILKRHPLRPGERGPVLTLTSRDAARYLQMSLNDESALPVSAGMQLSQYELLQGLLVPSANNFAEVLAVWDAGSIEAFVALMNAEAQLLGMTNTRYADVSGLSPATTSTPADQLVLARVAMANPVFREIVAMKEVRLPGIGLVSNVNQLLGQDGVIGIKTGMTEEAGGNLVFAAQMTVGGRGTEILGAVFGQANRPLAFDATRQILISLGRALQVARVVDASRPVASVKPEWGKAVDVLPAEDVDMLLWPGMTLETIVTIEPLKAPLAAGSEVGVLEVKLGEQRRELPLKLAAELPAPGLSWRLMRN
jgi:D-alanyl-D-alanine carboxypeptidase (penicillin-binding protein 5/6)